MSGCCNYLGRCTSCVYSGEYWFTLNNTERVLTCCCREPHNQPGTIIDWAEYPSQCPKDEYTNIGATIGWSVGVFLIVVTTMIVIYIYKRGFIQQWISRRQRQRDNDGIPLMSYQRSNDVYAIDLSTDI